MTLTTANRDRIAARREQVATSRLRGHTEREIALALHCSDSTVHTDLKHLYQQWTAAAAATIDQFKTLQLAEVGEVKRAAWAMSPPDLNVVIAAHRRESALLGLDEPAQTVLTVQRVVVDDLVRGVYQVISSRVRAIISDTDQATRLELAIADGLREMSGGRQELRALPEPIVNGEFREEDI
jgi:hypothetical protein